MNLNRKNLLETVGKWLIPSKKDLSVLSNLKLTVYGEKISFFSSGVSYENYAEFFHDENFSEPEIFTVLFPDFLNAVKSSKDIDCDIEIQEDRILVDSIPVKKTGNQDKMPEEFKRDKKTAEFFLPAEQWADIENLVIPHISDDETRYFMGGVFFESEENQLNLIATNGRTLARKIMPNTEKQVISAIVPVKYIKVGKIESIYLNFWTMRDSFNIILADFMQVLPSGTRHFHRVKCIEGDFPNYRRVVPENNTSFFDVETKKLTEILKKIKPFVDKKSKRIIVSQMEKTVDIQAGEVKFSVDCIKSNSVFSFAVNFDCLLVSLSNSAITRIQHCGDSMRAITIDNSNTLRIIMPMQLE